MRRAGRLLAAASAYLAVGVLAWWHVWADGVAHTITRNGYGDPAQQIWFLEWVPHALGAGLDPFVSHAVFAPAGINLMANSSILFPALVGSPITVLFGPVVSFNVLVVLAPAASALVAYLVFRRYTSFAFGAWLAGLFYGFSPFVLNDLADGHLHITTLVFPPLALLLLDDIAVSERGSAVVRGVLLGLVLTAQALTSLEVLSMMVLMSAIGLVLLAIYYHREVRARWRRTVTGLVAAGVTAALLLAWPLEVLFAGPQRYRGSIFVSPESYFAWMKALVWPIGIHHDWAAYIGLPLLILVLAGVLKARSALVRLAVLLALIALVFALGRSLHLTPRLTTGVPLPDRLITKAPFLENLLPVRFMIFVDLFVALAFAITLGALHDWIATRPGTKHATASVAAGLLGITALVSPALAAPFPYPTRQISVPAVYRSRTITRLPAGSILLAYPVMNGFKADPMIWQATEHMPYDMVAGYGFIPSKGPDPIGSLPKSPVTNLFGFAQIGLLGPSVPASEMRAVRHEIDGWKVSDIVVLDTGGRPRDLVRVLTAVLGRQPKRIDDAWVWLHLRPPALAS